MRFSVFRYVDMHFRSSLVASLLFSLAVSVQAEPLSKRVEIDFFRDTASRNLKGLATRSDGRIVAGPVFTDLKGPPLADLLWSLTPGTAGSRSWLVGTGPEGKVLEVTLDGAGPDTQYTVRTLATVDDTQVFVVHHLSNGQWLAGTSPNGGVYLFQGDQLIARATLPVDSILDAVELDPQTVLIATGNPGRIYRLDLKAFAAAGVHPEKITDSATQTARGFALFGEIRDRNVRRLAIQGDGRVLAGSAPKGNLYLFSRDGGPPSVLQENRDAEVTDLLVGPQGEVYASLVFAGTAGSARINRPAPAGAAEPAALSMLASAEPASERFSGRSTVVLFPPKGGFPETLVSRSGVAFYRLARRGDQLIIAGGEQGDVIGYDLKERRSLTFPGSVSSQINGLVGLDPRQFLVLRNNTAGLGLLDFQARGPRELETRRLDVGAPAQLGALRFGRLRDVAEKDVAVDLRTNFGSDEIEGWSAWTHTQPEAGGWRTEHPTRGRYLKLKVSLPESAPASLELDKIQLYYLAQNRRPTLTDFRIFSPNIALLPAATPTAQATTTLSQLLGPAKDTSTERRRNAFLSSPVVPSPGSQIVYWAINDPDDDAVTATFSIRREGETLWTDLAVNSSDSYVQFDLSTFPDGVYFTRLVVTEQAPRPAADRLTTTFETDDLIVDRTPPEIVRASAEKRGDVIVVTVQGRDGLSLLDGVEYRFNNGVDESVEQPLDGIRDSREETFTLELPLARATQATSVEVILYDDAGNTTSQRLRW